MLLVAVELLQSSVCVDLAAKSISLSIVMVFGAGCLTLRGCQTLTEPCTKGMSLANFTCFELVLVHIHSQVLLCGEKRKTKG